MLNPPGRWRICSANCREALNVVALEKEVSTSKVEKQTFNLDVDRVNMGEATFHMRNAEKVVPFKPSTSAAEFMKLPRPHKTSETTSKRLFVVCFMGVIYTDFLPQQKGTR